MLWHGLDLNGAPAHQVGDLVAWVSHLRSRRHRSGIVRKTAIAWFFPPCGLCVRIGEAADAVATGPPGVSVGRVREAHI